MGALEFNYRMFLLRFIAGVSAVQRLLRRRDHGLDRSNIARASKEV